ncbi:unnamed protein product [Kuraishia capsulata CBS 1993]|uniref:Mandelate racemase/muconate lactonizing enzyme C-terminal domain-containing protein n=1 Tax=Kuraishia capsulata CBS 1993 TaxID=1382522 RepID=W6MXF2_9ASCO|nr:uncharacterized protein KUCA_T00004770001 [Kuraishia capsulata CBS 1993]CDK28785.1 unnamed protein product [Kuraishia capsulata CBS 1993]
MVKIIALKTHDIRFPTTLDATGSDAVNFGDYSAAATYLTTDDSSLKGYGMTFTNGRGTEVVCACINALSSWVIGRELEEITANFGKFWHKLVSDDSLRWIGPEKGVIHLATASIFNAIWDLWARKEGKPVWRLVADFTPEQLVSTIDFSWIADVITPEEAIQLLKDSSVGKAGRIEDAINNDAVPIYSTTAGWLGYTDEVMVNLLHEDLANGHVNFKFKVGQDLAEDKRRLSLARKIIGDKTLMIDANQVWDVNVAIEWVKELAEFKPWFIEEPTSPDDCVGHKTIRDALKPYGIAVATGEMAQNRVIWKQLFQLGAIDIAQVDACRLGGLNEVLSVLLMAKKFGVQVCPHSGGVGLPELTQHVATIDYVVFSGKKSMLEYIGHLHENFYDPALVENGYVITPKVPGYSVQFKEESLATYEYPNGSFWTSEAAKPIVNKKPPLKFI